VDGRSDLYGLGCTMYFALTGQPPFPGGSAIRKIRRHRRKEAPPVTELNPLVPAGMADLVRRLMSKRPEDRPQSAAAVRRELLAWTPGGLEPATPEAAPEVAQIVAELEAERAGGPASVWDELPPVTLNETARPERRGLMGWLRARLKKKGDGEDQP
jgi:serine/threonine protein kinase